MIAEAGMPSVYDETLAATGQVWCRLANCSTAWAGSRQWAVGDSDEAGRTDGRQDDQWAMIEDDVLTVCQQRDAVGRTDIEEQCREELGRRRPPAWTEFA